LCGSPSLSFAMLIFCVVHLSRYLYLSSFTLFIVISWFFDALLSLFIGSMFACSYCLHRQCLVVLFVSHTAFAACCILLVVACSCLSLSLSLSL
jgi:hypothetical protein